MSGFGLGVKLKSATQSGYALLDQTIKFRIVQVNNGEDRLVFQHNAGS